MRLTLGSSSWKTRVEKGIPKHNQPPLQGVPLDKGVLSASGGNENGSICIQRSSGGLPDEEGGSDEDDDEDDSY